MPSILAGAPDSSDGLVHRRPVMVGSSHHHPPRNGPGPPDVAPGGRPATVRRPKEHLAMSGTVTMYSTTWCGYCNRLKSQLDREGIAYSEINIEQDPASAAYVESVNDGNQTVPTVVVVSASGEQSVMTNPSLRQVQAALA
ncbi:hypothetical protein Kpho02_13460 [Kitasatospora phosalacinea]|uniref:Glutaredoxin domain-containing protein n=2 Tax=Streptomycetaceae TaxID=2062 RepID=A0A9W6V1B2_9ACTN|nr:hypothetical protein Kpho02_13460 [Kitasatospora phosalacinea]